MKSKHWDVIDKLDRLLAGRKTKQIDQLIIETNKEFVDKDDSINMGGYTVGFFRRYIKSLGINADTTYTEALKRPTDEKFLCYFQNLELGTRADIYELIDMFQVDETEAKVVFNKILNKLKKNGWKFSIRDHGRQAWVIKKA